MKIITQVLLLTGTFLLITTSGLPSHRFVDNIWVGGLYSQPYSEQRTYQIYAGQTVKITIDSNFTLNVGVAIYFKNSSEISREYWLNNVTLFQINETFPLHLFSRQKMSKVLKFDQIAELTLTITYSPTMIFGDNNQLPPFFVFKRAWVGVIATGKDYQSPFNLSWILITLAAVTEATSLFLRRWHTKRNRTNALLFPFLQTGGLEEAFIAYNVFLMVVLFSFKGDDLFIKVLYSNTYAFPLFGNNILIQLLITIQAVVGVAVYGNMNRERLITFWSLPIPKKYYILLSEFTVILKVWLFVVVGQGVLAWFTFSIIYEVPVQLSTIGTMMIHMRYILLGIAITYLFLVLTKDISKGSAMSIVTLTITFFVTNGEQTTHNLIFASTDITSGQATFAWGLSLLVAIVTMYFNALTVRRYHLK